MKSQLWYLIFIVCSFAFANCNSEKKNTISEQEIAKEIHSNKQTEIEDLSRYQSDELNATGSSLVKQTIDDRVIPESIDIQLLTRLLEQGVNQKRKEQGRELLESSDVLKTAAENQNAFQAKIGKLSHYQTEDVFRDVQKRVLHFGGEYRIVGENVQYQGFQTITRNGVQSLVSPKYGQAAQQLVDGWINSPSHYENLINDQFDQVGTAIQWSDEKNALFATQVYGGN